MKVICVNIKELKDGTMDIELNNLSREDHTELEQGVADLLEQAYLRIIRSIADTMIKEEIIKCK